MAQGAGPSEPTTFLLRPIREYDDPDDPEEIDRSTSSLTLQQMEASDYENITTKEMPSESSSSRCNSPDLDLSDDDKYGTDPADWDRNDDKLKEHIGSIGQPTRNIAKQFPDSKRVYRDQSRYLMPSLFEMTTNDGRLLSRDWMIYSKSAGCIFCFTCRLFTANNIMVSTTGKLQQQ